MSILWIFRALFLLIRLKANLYLLSFFIVDKFEHHLDVLCYSFIRGILSNPINHYFWYVVDHLIVTFHSVHDYWLRMRLDQYFVALFAPLLSFSQELERCWIKISYKSWLCVKVSEPLLNICYSINFKRCIQCIF